jgi:hypothetical protein
VWVFTVVFSFMGSLSNIFLLKDGNNKELEKASSSFRA